MSRVRRDHRRCCRATLICMCGNIPDVVIYSKFHWSPFRRFRATVGRNLAFPITLAIGFYNSLYCCTSHDQWLEVKKVPHVTSLLDFPLPNSLSTSFLLSSSLHPHIPPLSTVTCEIQLVCLEQSCMLSECLARQRNRCVWVSQPKESSFIECLTMVF